MGQKVKQNQDTCEIFCYDEEKVKRISSIVEAENLAPVAGIFKALSDETRLKIAYSLLQEGELCVCDVANIIGATMATVSHHLRHLRNLGIAKSRKEGKLVFYSLDDEHVKLLVQTAVVHGKEVEVRD
ncbi:MULTISPECIES: ArsR/SmtB family transcription factor [Bacillaceae]|uniref:Cadmium efflux system accessory protein n=1 Tax=Halalkalibacter akibai (strain ATCC 43226 / DSM 21942 / CIP 109018 / JCM 9157 / 1139) TaxID=1236973 RepID=W4QXN8_HALA3|nr:MULTISPECIES: metalloregulator ArsR/SmtB family transcription factor [Bacillaceae]MED4164495.1 metalloregulator ArsR/SmtB family transcription factor [Halalkalibacterium halodurans]GAE36672.1 cadmium efflux system accessory protein [Halalkalibacter akibai JCM 9157]